MPGIASPRSTRERHPNNRRRLLGAGILSGVLAAACCTAALASIGAGISAVPIVASGDLVGAKTAKLRTFTVKNTGTEATTYRIDVAAPLPGVKGRRVPARWVLFVPRKVRLAAGQSRRISTYLRVPRRARPGRYAGRALLSAIAAKDAGAAVGVAAATPISFRIVTRRHR